ncbi:RlpA-like double-psi beta-barrel-protein domain-containing protein-containing protein [Flagelloscypha sp. PMI_526]|nr:RlpA-like double-psi beta-barrel-protein domain-containing protein-containing protein [Flagelloscypha sp. PMI_526]
MFSLIPAFVALSAALSASAHPLRSGNVFSRHHAVDIALRADGDRYADPEGWFTGYLEDYTTYHLRYLAIDCDDKHNTDFFDKCCHPMLATETLEKNRAPECNPANHSSSSKDTSSDDSDNDDDYEDCEESDDSDSSDSGNNHAATTAAPATTPTAKAKVATPSSSKKEETAPKSTKQEESKTTSSEAPKETKNNDSSNNNSDNNGSDNVGYKNTGIVTWYTQNGNKGACGELHSDDDLIAAMNSPQYKSLNVCGKSVMIHANNGKSVKVKVVDECPGCKEGSIDLSRGAFAQLGDFGLGTIDMSWNFV